MTAQLIKGGITEQEAKSIVNRMINCSVHAIQGSNLSQKRCAAAVLSGCRHRHRCLQRYQTSPGGLQARIHFAERQFLL
jgi:hypothetical protein